MSQVTSQPVTEFKSRVMPRLARIGRRIKMYAIADGLAWLGVIAAGCFVVQLALDWWLRLRVDLRAALLACVVAVIAWTLWRRVLRPLAARFGIEDVAAVIERRNPQIQTRLISAVEFSTGRARPDDNNSAGLIGRMLNQATSSADAWPMEAVLDHGRARRGAAVFCVVLAAFVLLARFAPAAMGVWFERNILLGDATWQQNTYLTVLNDDDGDGIIHAPLGDDLVLRVGYTGVRPDPVDVRFEFSSGHIEEHAMTAVGQDQFRHTLSQLTEPLTLRVWGGDARNDPVVVELVERPRVTAAEITVVPPAYTGEPSYQLRDERTLIEVLPGSEVALAFSPSQNLTSVVLHSGESTVGPVSYDGTRFVARFQPQIDANYWFELTDELGLKNTNPRQFLVRLQVDQPPAVRLDVPDARSLITTQAVLRAEVEVKDRFGLARAELRARVGGEDDQIVGSFEVSRGSKQLTSSRDIGVASLGVTEGGTLVVLARAEDLNDVTGPGVGKSAELAYRVVSVEELLSELARREQEFYQEFNQLVEMQEKIRSDILTCDRLFRNGAAGATQRRLQPLGRRQRQIAAQVGHVRGQFQSIFAELRLNQLASDAARARLIDGIVEPLDNLTTRTLAAMVDALIALHGAPDADRFADLDRRQADALAEMEAIQANMAKWEGFHESVSLLQMIIKLQKELQKETSGTVEEQFDELFESDDN